MSLTARVRWRFVLLLCVGVGEVLANDYPLSCLTQDYVICEGPPAFSVAGVSTIRIGANNNNGSPSGRAAVLIFALPVLSSGEQVATASLTVNSAGKSGSPTFNGDLWGIGFQSSTAPLLEYFEANTGDPTNAKLYDNFLTSAITTGNVTITNNSTVGAYIQNFYATNSTYNGGWYAFLRLNPDADSGTNSIGWSISAAESGAPAVLTLSTAGGPTNLPPQIVVQPQSVSVVPGATANLNVKATGSGTLGYRWRQNGSPLNDGGRLVGATSNAFSISAVTTNDAGAYTVLVTNAFGSITSSVATVSVLTPSTNACTNFIIIITDDQRWDSMGVVQREMGASGRFPWFTNGTPNMDRLAAEGVRFRNAFVTLSLCSPSRAAILTGRYNHLNGVIDNSTAFPTTATTYASLLRGAGYITGMVGKWHMGQQTARPGFDFSASFLGQGNYNDNVVYVNGVATATTGWVDDVSTDYALSFINSNYTRPFALQIGFKSTHGPNTPPDWAANLYSTSVSRDVPNLTVPPPYRTTISANGEAAKRTYHQCLTAADADIGRILERLDQLGIATNTMVIFLGDNGYYLGEHGLGDKRSIYEESLRVPLIVRYPRLAQPAIRDDLILNIDIAPTILDLAGVPVPASMQGRSWRPLLAGGSVTNWRQSFLAEYILESGYSIPTCVGLRTVDAKLVFWPGNPDWCEMFNISNDRYEITNLFNVAGSRTQRDVLKAEFDRQMRDTGLGATVIGTKGSGNSYTLTVTGGLGPNYQLQSSTNMTTWTPLSTVKMVSSTATVTNTTTTGARSFFRLDWIGD
jgi:arylsulfatase A-like enzyme